MSDPDWYGVLGVERGASITDIRRAYRKLALQWHPDKNLEDSDNATIQFQLVSQAYQILSDSNSRLLYDQRRNETFASRRARHTEFREEATFSMFESMRGCRSKRELLNIVVQLAVSLEEIFKQTRKVIVFRRKRVKRFEGSAVEITSIVDEEAVFKVDLKAYWNTGTKLVYSNEGNQNHEKSGDLIIEIVQLPHKLFVRMESTLEVHHSISLKQALAGEAVAVPTIDGKHVEYVIERGKVIYPGMQVRIPGEGMVEEYYEKRGDLLVIFEVTFPKTLSLEVQEMLSKVL